MTLVELNNQLTNNLKAFLKKRNHISSGKLYNKIRITSDANLKFSVAAYEYIQYLDDGKFFNDFWELPSTLELIGNYISSVANDLLD